MWLTQRGIVGARGGFNGFLVAMVMGYLLRVNDKNGVRRLANSFSSYQLFKVTIGFLGELVCAFETGVGWRLLISVLRVANHDFKAEPLFMTPDGKPLADTEVGFLFAVDGMWGF